MSPRQPFGRLRGWGRLGRVGEEGWEQVRRHERVGVGGKGSGFGEDKGLRECLEGVLRVREVLSLPPWQWEWRVAVAPLLLSLR